MASMTGSQGERNSSPDPVRQLMPAPPRGAWAALPERAQSLSGKPFVLNAKASSFVPSPRPSITVTSPRPSITENRLSGRGSASTRASTVSIDPKEMPFEVDSRLRALDGSPVPALALLEAGRKSLSETWARGGDRRDIVVEQLEHIRARRRSNSISVHSKSTNKETSSKKNKPPYRRFGGSGSGPIIMPNNSTRKSEPSCTITDLPGGGRMSFSDQVHLSDRMNLEKRLSARGSASSRASASTRASTVSIDSAGMSVWDVRKSLVDLKIAASNPPAPIDYSNSCKRRSFQFDQLKKWTDTPESTGRRSRRSSLSMPRSSLSMPQSPYPQSPYSARSNQQPPHSPYSAGSFRESLLREPKGPSSRAGSQVVLDVPQGSSSRAGSQVVLDVPRGSSSRAGSQVVQDVQESLKESLEESLKESASLPLGATAAEPGPRLSTNLPENTTRPFNADADGNPIVKLDSLIKMGRNGAPRNGGGCYECGMPGHFSRDCPERFRAPKHTIPLDRPPASYLQEKGLTLEHPLKPGDPGWLQMEEKETQAEMEWRARWGRIPPIQSDRHAELRAACVKRAERKWLWENLGPMDH